MIKARSRSAQGTRQGDDPVDTLSAKFYSMSTIVLGTCYFVTLCNRIYSSESYTFLYLLVFIIRRSLQEHLYVCDMSTGFILVVETLRIRSRSASVDDNVPTRTL